MFAKEIGSAAMSLVSIGHRHRQREASGFLLSTTNKLQLLFRNDLFVFFGLNECF